MVATIGVVGVGIIILKVGGISTGNAELFRGPWRRLIECMCAQAVKLTTSHPKLTLESVGIIQARDLPWFQRVPRLNRAPRRAPRLYRAATAAPPALAAVALVAAAATRAVRRGIQPQARDTGWTGRHDW